MLFRSESALYTDDVGTSSTAIGKGALFSQNIASAAETGNSALGLYAGYYNVTGTNNTYLGLKAGQGVSEIGRASCRERV